jgi:hypothetical protein
LKIDNSQAVSFLTCPQKWLERYQNNIELRVRGDSLDFGTRIHQLLEERCKSEKLFEPLSNEQLEAEAQLTYEAYCAYYPEEPFEVVGVEQYFEVKLPCGACHDEGCGQAVNPEHHTYCGEFDAIVRMKDSGRLRLFETKTEGRYSKANIPEAWASKSQVGLYIYAAQQVYGEEFEGIILNVITRQSPKGNCPPIFRRDDLVRTKQQQEQAVRNLVWVADSIERMQVDYPNPLDWPQNRNNCVSQNGWKCDFWGLHIEPEGRPIEELVQLKYQTAKPYLSGL